MVAVDVRVPGLLARFTDDDRRVAVEAATVRGAVLALVEYHPALESHVLDDGGNLRTHLQVFHEGDRVDWGGAASVALGENDEVVVLQAVSGG